MRQHSVLAKRSSGTVGSGTVQIHRAGRSFVCRQAAGQQGRRHTGQYISAAAPGKAWVSGRVCAHAAIRCSHHGTAALEYHHSVPFFCILAGSIFTVRIDLRHRKPGEPGHLAGVRGHDQLSRRVRQRFALGQQLRGGVQAVRMDKLFDAALAVPEISGIILNPWNRTIQLDKTLIRIIKGA